MKLLVAFIIGITMAMAAVARTSANVLNVLKSREERLNEIRGGRRHLNTHQSTTSCVNRCGEDRNDAPPNSCFCDDDCQGVGIGGCCADKDLVCCGAEKYGECTPPQPNEPHHCPYVADAQWSCAGRCGEDQFDAPEGADCFCDEHCFFSLQDCCPDYAVLCEPICE